jgi:hypothetical protein
MAGAISDQTTTLSNVSLTGNVAASQVSAPTVAVGGGPVLSGKTVDLRTNVVRLSYATEADVSGLTLGTLGIVFQASGISLIYSSGKTVYVVGQSAQSAAGA